MNSHLSRLTALTLLLLAGCAEVPPQVHKIERLSAEEIEQRLPQPPSSVSLADIVAMSTAGNSIEVITKHVDASHARYRLSATQIVDLQRQGVALPVLDHLVAAERRAVFEDLAADIAKRDQTCRQQLDLQERQCRLQAVPPLWQYPIGNCWPPYHPHPYWP
jgi:hypothetical protein